MLHLYFLLIIAGQPQMTMQWGSDEPDSCQEARVLAERDLDATFADPAKVAQLRTSFPGVTRGDARIECRFYTPETLPKLRDPTLLERKPQ